MRIAGVGAVASAVPADVVAVDLVASVRVRTDQGFAALRAPDAAGEVVVGVVGRSASVAFAPTIHDKLADLPTVTIQVLRPEEGVHAVHATGGFVLLNLDAVSQVGYIELLDDAVYLYDRDRIRTYEVGAQDLQRVALDPEESLALIRSMIT